MHHIFRAEQWLPFSVELVFSFFADPENLPRLMPPWQKARIEEASFSPPPPRPPSADPELRLRSIAAGKGTRINISFRPFPFSPFRLRWDAEITEFAWNDHFCDTELRGPFASWHHCHHVSPETRNDVQGTLLSDSVDYEMRLGRLGDLAHRVFVKRQINKIFAFRHQRTAELIPMMRAVRSVLKNRPRS